MKNNIDLKSYLMARLSPGSIPTHLTNIANLQSCIGKGRTKKAGYKDIMEYLDVLRKKYSKPATVQSYLNSIKHYYHYLIHTGQRKDHPCRYLNLKDLPKNQIQLQDLLKPEEMEQLLHLHKYPRKVEQRTQVIISLLIYQGLTKGEILNIKLKDISLDKATISITAATARTLPLKSNQIMLLHRYIHEERHELLKRGSIPEDHPSQALLILSCLGASYQSTIFTQLMKYLRKILPDKKITACKIRQSVIANLLKKGKDIRIVQTFAGHRYPDSTERYRQTGIEQLKQAIRKHHPLQ